MYSEKVSDHFTNPRNAGELKNPDGVGMAGNHACGDRLKIEKTDSKNKCLDMKTDKMLEIEKRLSKPIDEFLKEESDNVFGFPEDNKNFFEMIMGDTSRFPYNYKSVKIEEQEKESEDNQQYNVFVYQLLLYPPNINDKIIQI